MKLVSYESGGVHSYGAVVDDRIVDLRGRDLGESIKELLATTSPGSLAGVVASAVRSGDGPRLDDVTLDPVVPDPAKVICVGVNYKSHRDETQRPDIDYPTIFFRFADTQIGAGRPVPVPGATERFDYEGELAVVIGSHCRDVAESDALSVVAGYSCYNDMSARDWQRHASQWGPGKNFPGTGPFGPWLVTADEIADPEQLELTTRVNGEVRQSASLADLIFSVPNLIAYVSAFTPLAPGDVLVTGTPGGVGLFMDPPRFLRPGDTVEVEISGIGILRNVVA